MPTVTKKMPTPAQMKTYAEKLPKIYRDLLMSMFAIDPDRVRGDTFHFPTLRSNLSSTYSQREIYTVLMELESQDYLSLDEGVGFIELTELGEELLAAIAGKRPKDEVIPKLPKPHGEKFCAQENRIIGTQGLNFSPKDTVLAQSILTSFSYMMYS